MSYTGNEWIFMELLQLTWHEEEPGLLPRTGTSWMQMSGFMHAGGEAERSAGWISVNCDLPLKKTCCLSRVRCSGVCKAHSVISILKRRAWNITYSIRHERRITTCQIQNQFLEFNLFFFQQGWWNPPPPSPSPPSPKFAFSFFSSPHFKNSLSFPIPFLHWLLDIISSTSYTSQCKDIIGPHREGVRSFQSRASEALSCQSFTAKKHSTFIFFPLWCKRKIPQLLETLKIWTCLGKECQIWKKGLSGLYLPI